jgi:hypothetical protein
MIDGSLNKEARSMRRLLLVLVICLALASGLPWSLVFAQSCGECVPALLSGVEGMTGFYRICINDANGLSLTATQQWGIKQGIENYWQGYFSANGIPVTLEVLINSSGCDVTVKPDSQAPANFPPNWMAGAAWTWDGRGSEIIVNSAYIGMGDQADWRNVGAHEFGHVAGLGDLPESCSEYSIMGNPHPAGLDRTQGLRCGDATALYEKYPPRPSGGGDSEYRPSQYVEDCWDVYEVYYYYGWVYNHWLYLGSDSYYLYTTCEPRCD